MPRFQFLNWRPDLEDTEFEGLTVADNVVHDVEGWKEVQFVTDGAVSTLVSSSIYFASGQTIGAMQVRQLGNLFDTSINNKVAAYTRDGSTPNFVVDFFNTTTPASTGISNAITSAHAVTAFQSAELNKVIVVCAQATGTAASGTSVSLNITGYTDIT